ncbi:MAG: hypothetical protein JOZ62_00195, partial [Acidobacteriaceae bacterium]|nr:hypothetical protein [Acidobacteriaceae bacterium]
MITRPDPLTALTLGNGDLGFRVDVTGLQTFAGDYDSGVPLGTLSQWGWHSFPNPQNYTLKDVLRNYDTHGRPVPYAGSYEHDPNVPERVKNAVSWLRENPHRIDLGRIGLVLKHSNGAAVAIRDLANIHQQLELWSGRVESQFSIDGTPVEVVTVCHPDRDVIAVEIRSPLLRDKRLGVFLAFPYALGAFGRAADWNSPERHTTELTTGNRRADIKHVLDSTEYFATIAWSEEATLAAAGVHRYEIFAPAQDHLQLTISFAPRRQTVLPIFAQTSAAAAEHWKDFWSSGGAIDLSGSTDPRARELERRIVLSEYLTAINSTGELPPQETGLEMDSWYGKFHLEMYWWHAAHFALWGRPELLERSMAWYVKVQPLAEQTARRQGYAGARWPKMVGPDGRESPSDIGDFL